MYFGLKPMFYKYEWGFNHWDEVRVQTVVKHLDLVCLKRDSAALQAIVAADQDFLLTVGRDPLFWKEGPLDIARIAWHTDPRLHIQVKLIGLIEDDNRVHKSDILLDQGQIHVEKHKLQQVWIELTADADTPAGVYSGKLQLYTHTMFEDEQMKEELSFSVTVLEDTLPEPKDYSFYLDLWQHNSNLARKYQVELWSDEHFRVMDAYLASMGQLGQKALTVLVSEIPWSGQFSHRDSEPSDMFEYSMIRVTRKEDGAFTYDFSAADRYVEMGRKHGITEEIELFGLLNVWQNEAGYGQIVDDYPDGIRVRYYDEGPGCFRFMRERQQLAAYVQALEAHWIANGSIDKVRVIADEPSDFDLFNRRMDALRQMAPSFRYKAAIDHAEFIRRRIPGMTDYVPILNCAANESDQIDELRPAIPGKLMFYVCCFPDKPNTFIRSPSIEARFLPWLAEKLGYDGFLRWNYTAWPDRPLEKLSYRPAQWPAGDTNFVYPGTTGRPMLSLRYKWLQRGIRDYEYMQILKRTGRTEQVETAMRSVIKFEHIKQLYSGAAASALYSFDPADYDRIYSGGVQAAAAKQV